MKMKRELQSRPEVGFIFVFNINFNGNGTLRDAKSQRHSSAPDQECKVF